ncbi:exosortase family protein XrtF [Chryseolinea sp. T2]|uniref:exosortase family protein XrtF n=1 Tax=Chryseolinea sp. T2 TaxID=3129255 RepID=UPI003077438A
MRATIREFLPTIIFLGKFLGIFLVASLLYGAYVSSFEPGPDSVTSIVARHSAGALNIFGWTTNANDNLRKPTTEISLNNRDILSIYEGCNGVNVMIIFVAFLLAFGPVNRRLWWYIPMGLVILHLCNLFRITALFWVSLNKPDFMYFLHKYFFTAALYVVTFALWVIWVRMYLRPRTASL